jgi:hypothetical protein
MAKLLRIIRVVTTVTDVDMESYFDFAPSTTGESEKCHWTVEEAITYEQGRGQTDKHEAFELAIQNGEMTGFVQAFDVIDDKRTADEKIADEQHAAYLTPSRDVLDLRSDESVTERIGPEETPRHKTPMAGLPGDAR